MYTCAKKMGFSFQVFPSACSYLWQAPKVSLSAWIIYLDWVYNPNWVYNLTPFKKGWEYTPYPNAKSSLILQYLRGALSEKGSCSSLWTAFTQHTTVPSVFLLPALFFFPAAKNKQTNKQKTLFSCLLLLSLSSPGNFCPYLLPF